MSTQSIPLLWDTGEVSLVSADSRGVLRLRPSSDATVEQNLRFLQGVARMPSGWPATPLTNSPSISPMDAEALIEEMAWHDR